VAAPVSAASACHVLRLTNNAAISMEKTNVLTPVKTIRFKIKSKFDKLKISRAKNARW
jgi:hypothetical protein